MQEIASIAKFYQVPMVVTPVGELPNEVIHNETGIVCASSDPIDIANGITKCLSSLTLFSDKLKFEKEIHSWDNFADELLSFVNELKG